MKESIKNRIKELDREYKFLSDRGLCTMDVKVKIMNLQAYSEYFYETEYY